MKATTKYIITLLVTKRVLKNLNLKNIKKITAYNQKIFLKNNTFYGWL